MNQKGFSAIVGIIIAAIVIAAGIGGYLVWKKPSQPVAQNTSVEKISVPSDWKTYRNEKVSLELQYPPTTAIKENFVGNFNNSGTDFLALSFIDPEFMGSIYVNDPGRGIGEGMAEISTESIIISGIPTTLTILGDVEKKQVRLLVTGYQKGRNQYTVAFWINGQEPSIQSLIKKIIATIK